MDNKILIVGLGNPGLKYSLNRHNIGFMAIDFLVNLLGLYKIEKFDAIFYKSEDIFFVKPTTFMNSSGDSVAKFKNFYKIKNNNIIVIHDDLDLPFGSIRFKIGGSNGGHNGLKSLDKIIKNDYIRIRVGIGRPQDKKDVIDYVLSDFLADELKIINNILLPHIKDAIFALLENGLDYIKSRYTKK